MLVNTPFRDIRNAVAYDTFKNRIEFLAPTIWLAGK